MPHRRPEHFFFFTVAGAFLALVAGYVNVVTVLSPAALTATHVTGMATRIAATWGGQPYGGTVGLAAGAILAFLVGAAVSGAVLDSTRLVIGRRYGALLMLEAALLAGAALMLTRSGARGVWLAAAASGLQNALATTYTNAVVRTTHITGLLTDLGIAVGKWAARRDVQGWRVQIYVALLTGFMAGAALGAEAHLRFAEAALWGPAGVVFAVGICYSAWRHRALRTGRLSVPPAAP